MLQPAGGSTPRLPELSPRQQPADAASVTSASTTGSRTGRKRRSPHANIHGTFPNTNSSPISSWPGTQVSALSSPARPKSCLLLEMETYLQRELAALGEDEYSVPEVRLQIFRECFQMFISHFREYSSILSSIMKEYDQAFQLQQGRIQSTLQQKDIDDTKLERASAALEVECSKLKDQAARLKREIAPLENQVRKLRNDNEALKDDLAVARKELAVKESEFKDEYERNRQLATALREQAERQHRAHTDLKNLELEKNKHKETVQHLNQQLQETIRDKEEKRKQEDLDQIQRLDQAVLDLKEEVTEYKVRIKNLIAQNWKTSTEMKQLRHKYDRYVAAVRLENGRAMTPRPEWRRIFQDQDIPWPNEDLRPSSTEHAKAVLEGIHKLQGVIKEIEIKSKRADVISEFMEDENIADITTMPKQQRFFIGKGTHEHLPKYLRYHGKIKYLGLSKGETERMVKEVWQEKTTHKLGNQNYRDVTMKEFLYMYLMNKCDDVHDKAVELAYNLLDTMERNRYDADLELFLKVLDGKVPEAVFYDQNKMVQSVKLMFAKLDPNNKLKVPRKACKSALVKLFPAKSHEDMLKVRYYLMLDQQGPSINFKHLFIEDEEGNQGKFIECLRDQHLHEIQEYMVDVEQALRQASDQNGMINLSTVKQVIQEDDIEKPEPEINNYIVRGVGCQRVSEINWDAEIPVDTLVANMQKGLMKRTGKRPEKKYIKKEFPPDNGANMLGKSFWSGTSFYNLPASGLSLNASVVNMIASSAPVEPPPTPPVGTVTDAESLTNDESLSRQQSNGSPFTLTPTPPPYPAGMSGTFSPKDGQDGQQ
eukprot:TRINITY_DN55744_c0_g1_i1.p1 TRINITY_DN55744_c0_g1~~TRINITY_DN55744_c0_g1_i1.p1  ORF type:complete len:824 (+),score=116.52 TRINITY_DN55744_c0_g1_i1:93-2564(+)